VSRREPAARVTLAERWVLAVGWVLVLTALVAGIWASYTWPEAPRP